ncbi:hypothetical protein GCM10022380_31350 [Amycolatopsis tucumanensis]|uniref:Uncharacterized protein n=1 Tax=Amycolatopsis tucumanensis TaxID=401106 RepID=A0ABP7I5Y9_9PSEU
MARISDLKIATTASGQRQLRFSATIVNVGRGPFELVADRASEASSSWSPNGFRSRTAPAFR